MRGKRNYLGRTCKEGATFIINSARYYLKKIKMMRGLGLMVLEANSCDYFLEYPLGLTPPPGMQKDSV